MGQLLLKTLRTRVNEYRGFIQVQRFCIFGGSNGSTHTTLYHMLPYNSEHPEQNAQDFLCSPLLR